MTPRPVTTIADDRPGADFTTPAIVAKSLRDASSRFTVSAAKMQIRQ